MLGEGFRDALARLTERPEVVLPTARGWRLAASARNLTVRDVRDRLGDDTEDGAWPPSMTVATVFKELHKISSDAATPSADPGPDDV